MNYKDSGVDTKLADQIMKEHLVGFSSEIGKFAATLNTSIRSYSGDLVASVDGVGTKVLLAKDYKTYTGHSLNGIGKDCVAMVMNDIICEHAIPIMFMDYYATGKLIKEDFLEVLSGMQDYCTELNIPILGGETAEMPGMFQPDAFDVCGFGLGNKIGKFDEIEKGDLVIGLKSSGVHSNGFSLIRKIDSVLYSDKMKQLLEPTKLYYEDITALRRKSVSIKGIAHITGGGWKNFDRILKGNSCKWINDWNVYYDHKQLFEWIQKETNATFEEMYNTFNCGIGMMVIIKRSHIDNIPLTNFVVLGEIN